MNATSSFTLHLLDWHHSVNDRILPWKEEKDAYKIWLSEIILQQTTAQQGMKYYNKFIERYPTVTDLAEADDDEVYKMWEGLGYYSRCKNLLKSARHIVSVHNGHFPNTYKEVLALPGVGDYTAAAIMSFAYGAPHAVLDGNVFRVLSRYFGIYTPIDTTAGKQEFQSLAQSLMSISDPAAYNQAIMDFGATVCKPKNPLCDSCPLSAQCYVQQNDIQLIELPVKEKKIEKKTRYFNYFIITNPQGAIYFEKREEQDIWQKLFQPLLIETPENVDINSHWKEIIAEKLGCAPAQLSMPMYLDAEKQVLTHRVIQSKFFHINISASETQPLQYGKFYHKDEYMNLSFPKTIFSFMSKNTYF